MAIPVLALDLDETETFFKNLFHLTLKLLAMHEYLRCAPALAIRDWGQDMKDYSIALLWLRSLREEVAFIKVEILPFRFYEPKV